MMKTLIIKEKDLLIKESFIGGMFIFLFSLIYIAVSKFELGNSLILLYIVVTSVFIFVVASLEYDNKSKADMLLNSLPISRDEIVCARYLSTIIMTLFSLIFFIFSTVLIGISIIPINELMRIFNKWDMILAISLVFIINSFSFPIYYYNKGHGKSSAGSIYTNLPLLIVISLNLMPKMNFNLTKYFRILKNPITTLSLFIISIVLYYISLQLSKKIYRSKEFS